MVFKCQEDSFLKQVSVLLGQHVASLIIYIFLLEVVPNQNRFMRFCNARLGG